MPYLALLPLPVPVLFPSKVFDTSGPTYHPLRTLPFAAISHSGPQARQVLKLFPFSKTKNVVECFVFFSGDDRWRNVDRTLTSEIRFVLKFASAMSYPPPPAHEILFQVNSSTSIICSCSQSTKQQSGCRSTYIRRWRHFGNSLYNPIILCAIP